MLPFSYAVRNLFRSKTRLVQMTGGSALVILLVMTAVTVNQGMERVLSASGSERNVILLGAGSEESIQRSEVAESTAGIAAASIPGISKRLGEPAVSSEIHYMNHATVADRKVQAVFRGVTVDALGVHDRVRLIDGTFPRSGELMAGRLAWRKLGLGEADLRTGAVLSLDGQDFTVSGVFAAPGTVLESEFWVPLGDLRVAARREGVSCVVLRLDDAADFAEADLFAKQRLDLGLSALRESDYYRQLASFFQPLRVMTWITAGLITAGAILGGFNTLYAAFAPRVREMATLQAIGFRRFSLLLSLVQESLFTCLCGALLASLAALWLLDGRTMAFSIGAFTLEVGPATILAGITAGILLGLLGAMPPALRCLRPPLPSALRMS